MPYLLLVLAHVPGKIHRTAGETVGGIAAHGRGIKGCKISSSNQECHYQHGPHRLPALKFHHGSGNQILIGLSFVPPIHHRVEQNHIDADQRWQIKQAGHHGRRIPVEHIHKEGGHQITGQRSPGRQQDACPSIPALYLMNRLGTVGFLHHVHDVGGADSPAPHPEQDCHHIGRKEQGQQIGCRVKGQGHLLGVHQKQPEQLPDAPGQRAAQSCPRCTGYQRQHRQFLSHFGPQLPPGSPQGQEKAGLPGFLPEEQTRRIGRKDGASHHRQHKDHHHLFAGIAALGQHRKNGGGTHHTAVGCHQQNRKEAASCQQSITALVFAAQHPAHL